MITIQCLYDKMTQSDRQCSYSIINIILKENLKLSALSVSDFSRNFLKNFFISISINFFHLIFARNLLLL